MSPPHPPRVNPTPTLIHKNCTHQADRQPCHTPSYFKGYLLNVMKDCVCGGDRKLWHLTRRCFWVTGDFTPPSARAWESTWNFFGGRQKLSEEHTHLWTHIHAWYIFFSYYFTCAHTWEVTGNNKNSWTHAEWSAYKCKIMTSTGSGAPCGVTHAELCRGTNMHEQTLINAPILLFTLCRSD